MSKADYCHLYLTCENTVEASRIVKVLLEKRLIVCAKQSSVDSTYLWHKNVEHNQETLLIMESALEMFDAIEAEVAKIHSYETFVLEAVPVAKVSKQAQIWMEENLKHGTA
jgi:periplasmic divalent cation tolerance protein